MAVSYTHLDVYKRQVVCDVTRQLRGEAPSEVQIQKRHAGMAQMVGGTVGRVNPEAGFMAIITA